MNTTFNNLAWTSTTVAVVVIVIVATTTTTTTATASAPAPIRSHRVTKIIEVAHLKHSRLDSWLD